jgi:imidazoleglycerol phosphate dehydratase HisB
VTDTGIDRHHAVKDTGLSIGIELNQDGLHGYAERKTVRTEIGKPQQP